MSGNRVLVAVAMTIGCVLFPGCAAKQKKRIAALEQINAKLTDQLNQTQGELDNLGRSRSDLNDKYLAAAHDAEALRRQLAERPEPETAAPGWTPVPGGAMIAIETGVLFAPGKATLHRKARRTLDAIVGTIQGDYRDKAIFVIGHTDDRPIRKSGWKDNWELSSQRSLAVVRYLTQQSIPASRLMACGAGEHRPRVDNSSASNRSTNRRVEIFAVDPHILNTQN